jgi:hypothetical protein
MILGLSQHVDQLGHAIQGILGGKLQIKPHILANVRKRVAFWEHWVILCQDDRSPGR